jgi:hypothetical protein
MTPKQLQKSFQRNLTQKILNPILIGSPSFTQSRVQLYVERSKKSPQWAETKFIVSVSHPKIEKQV